MDSGWKTSKKRMIAELVIVIGLVVLPLSFIYFRTNLEESFALSFSEPSVCQFWTGSIIHHEGENHLHLRTNLIGSVIVLSSVYLTVTYFAGRKVFYVWFSLILATGAVVTQVSSFVWFHSFADVEQVEGGGGGFSGVIAAFGGLLLAVAISATRSIFGEMNDRGAIPVLYDNRRLLLGIALVYAIVAYGINDLYFTDHVLVEDGPQGNIFVDLGSHLGGGLFGLLLGLAYFLWINKAEVN